MGTPIGARRTEPRKPMKRTPIKKVSAKQSRRNRELAGMESPEDNRCQKCGQLPDWRGLAKHHKVFRSHGGTDDESNLIWVCGRCHSELHGIIEH